MRPLPDLPRPRLGVLSGAEARAAGWTTRALVCAVESGRLVRLRRDAYALPPDASLHPAERADRARAQAAVAAALTTPGVVASHLAAATAWGGRSGRLRRGPA